MTCDQLRDVIFLYAANAANDTEVRDVRDHLAESLARGHDAEAEHELRQLLRARRREVDLEHQQLGTFELPGERVWQSPLVRPGHVNRAEEQGTPATRGPDLEGEGCRRFRVDARARAPEGSRDQ